jgi:hypothetical protein
MVHSFSDFLRDECRNVEGSYHYLCCFELLNYHTDEVNDAYRNKGDEDGRYS